MLVNGTEVTIKGVEGVTEQEVRGYFEHTDRNLFEGQDLDVPTYLRKGIKLSLQ